MARSATPKPAGRSPLTDRDRRLLNFVAEHRVVLGRHLERLAATGGRTLAPRLRGLVGGGYLRGESVFGEACYQIRRPGLVAIGSRLPVPRFQLGGYKHDVGLAWLWLAARDGTFGPLSEILSERRMRSHDGAVEHPADPYGIRLGGRDRWDAERLHYPDLLLVDPAKRRLAVEFELSSKGRARRELILGGYGADRRIDAVLYVVEDNPAGRAIGRLVTESARAMDLAGRVGVQLVKPLRLTGASSADAGTLQRRVSRRPAAHGPPSLREAGVGR